MDRTVAENFLLMPYSIFKCWWYVQQSASKFVFKNEKWLLKFRTTFVNWVVNWILSKWFFSANQDLDSYVRFQEKLNTILMEGKTNLYLNFFYICWIQHLTNRNKYVFIGSSWASKCLYAQNVCSFGVNCVLHPSKLWTLPRGQVVISLLTIQGKTTVVMGF